MLRLENFSKEILIAVIKRKWFSHQKEILEECVQIKCDYDFKKVSKRIDFLINENKRLGTSLEEKLKYIKNRKELVILFEKQEKILDRENKRLGTSLEEKLKYIKNRKELVILFEKQEKILDRMGK